MATIRQRANYHYMAETMRALEFHLHGRIEASGRIPEEWHEIARARGTQPKVKVNMWVEADVVRFFKGTGQGWSTRMAEVLRTFMQARLAGLVKGAEDTDYTLTGPDERRHRITMLRELLALEGEG
jgi:uncharacterized protein (DUF4415 family)